MRLVEKPREFVSDLGLVGVYLFDDSILEACATLDAQLARRVRDHRGDPVADRSRQDRARRDARRLVEGHGTPRGPAGREPDAAGALAPTSRVGRRATTSKASPWSRAGAKVTDSRLIGPVCIGAGLPSSRARRSGPTCRWRPDRRSRDSTIRDSHRDGRAARSTGSTPWRRSILGRNVEVRHAVGGDAHRLVRRRSERRRGRLSAHRDRRPPRRRPAPDGGRDVRRGARCGICPRAMPEDRFVAWYLDVRGVGRRPRRFAAWSPNLSEHASRIPSRVVRPGRVADGLPRAGVARRRVRRRSSRRTSCPPPTRLARASCSSSTTSRSRRCPRRRRTTTSGGAGSFARWLRRRSAVIVPSEATRDDLLATHDVDADKVTSSRTAPTPTPSRRCRRPEVEAMRARFRIPGPYIVFLGGLEPRKNLERLIQAFGMVERDRRRRS